MVAFLSAEDPSSTYSIWLYGVPAYSPFPLAVRRYGLLVTNAVFFALSLQLLFNILILFRIMIPIWLRMNSSVFFFAHFDDLPRQWSRRGHQLQGFGNFSLDDPRLQRGCQAKRIMLRRGRQSAASPATKHGLTTLPPECVES